MLSKHTNPENVPLKSQFINPRVPFFFPKFGTHTQNFSNMKYQLKQGYSTPPYDSSEIDRISLSFLQKCKGGCERYGTETKYHLTC